MRITYLIEGLAFPFRIDGASITAHDFLMEMGRRENLDVRALSGSLREYRPPPRSHWEACSIRQIQPVPSGMRVVFENYALKMATSPAQEADADESDVVWVENSLKTALEIKSKPRVLFVHSELQKDDDLRRSWRKGVSLCTCSRYMRDRIKRRSNVDAHVVTPLVRPERVLADGGERDRISFINPHAVKGFATFVEIAKALPEEKFLCGESWSLRGERMQWLRTETDSLENVEVLRRSPDMRPFYGRTRILLMPSIWEEAHGRVIREAQLNGIPVIASRRGGIPDTAGAGALLVDDYTSPAAWVEAVKRVSGDRILRQELVAAGYENANKPEFSPDACVDRFLEFLRTAAHGALRKYRWKCNADGTLRKHRAVFADFEPPCTTRRAWPADYETGAPDFVGVGAQRSGTSKTFKLLSQHPEIHVPVELSEHLKREAGMGLKERHWFERFMKHPWRDEYVDAYRDDFPRFRGKKTGEWTACMMYSWWMLPLLKKCAPDARILVSLRDPVERYVSGMAYVKRRVMNESMVASDAFHRGCYATQLKRLLEVYPREQVLVIQFERLIRDPVGTARKVYAHVGVDPRYEPENPEKVVNPHRAEKWDQGELRPHLVEMYAEEVRETVRMFPDELDPSLWENFKEVLRC